jgi:PKD repeat protein
VPVGATISVTAPFTDPDRDETFTAIWDWGDGATSPGVVDLTAQLVVGSHPCDQPGVYSVRLVLFDRAGARSNEVTAEVVVAVIQPLYLPLVVMNQAAVYAVEVTAEGVLATSHPLYLPLVLR